MNRDVRGKVLIIDDNPMNLHALLLYLENAGFDILIATSGEQALKQLTRSHPDLILLDVLMPDMDGFETCRHLKLKEDTKDIPVIFMTALTDTTNKIKGFEAGGVDYVTKPLQHEEVLARINTHFTIRKLQQQLQQQNGLLEEKNEQLEREITDRTRAEEALRRYNRELSLLQDMGDLLQTCHTEEETYHVVVKTCEQLFHDDSGCLCIMSNSGKGLKNVGKWGPLNVTPRLLKKRTSEVAEHGRLHIIENIESDPLYLYVPPSPEESYPYALRNTSGDILGILFLCPQTGLALSSSAEHPPPVIESKLMILSRVAEHYALVLGNLRLRETLKMESIHDPLTGLYNRRHMEAFLDREVRRSERRNTYIGFIMFDLDHFKRINDTLGHDAGDVVLKHLGLLMQNSIRGGDIACRYGGEEFLLIMPEVSVEIAQQRAEELRKRVQELTVYYGNTSIQITISAGVATIPEHGFDAADVIKAADEALYQAKSGGRNLVVLASKKVRHQPHVFHVSDPSQVEKYA